MIVSLVARFQETGVIESNAYAAWAEALFRLRTDWENGRHPAPAELADYLEDVPADQRFAAVQDLIGERLRLAWRDGPGPRLEAWFPLLETVKPGFGQRETVPAELVEDEFLARCQPPHGDFPAAAEYTERFPGREDVAALLGARCLDGGRYVKLCLRGMGAMGRVWEAWDRAKHALVAVKEPRPELAGNDLARRRFRAETDVTAGLEHPALVCARLVEPVDDGPAFHVMRLVDGPTLSERIHDWHIPPPDRSPGERRAAWDELLGIFAAVCDAMEHSHTHGVIHRDLKPGHIVLDGAGQPLILDWGMAMRSGGEDCATPGAETGDGALAGTPEYLPPEQVDGIAGARSDVFGLGAILYEILAARPPHPWPEGTRPANWQEIVRACRIPRPGQWKAGTPAPLEHICMKALAPRPEGRYRNAAELAQAVRRSLADRHRDNGRPFWSRLRKRLKSLAF